MKPNKICVSAEVIEQLKLNQASYEGILHFEQPKLRQNIPLLKL